MSRPKATPRLDRLSDLREEAAAAAARAQQAHAEQQAVQAEAAELREQVTEAFARGEEERATRLDAKRVKADQAAAGPWAERIAGAERAARRAQAERDGFVASNYHALVRERAPVAREAARRIELALRALVEARQEWIAEEREQIALTRAVGHLDGRAITGLGDVDELVKLAQRAVGSVPAPLPRESLAAAVAPFDDPDLEIRDAARTKIATGGPREDGWR